MIHLLKEIFFLPGFLYYSYIILMAYLREEVHTGDFLLSAALPATLLE